MNELTRILIHAWVVITVDCETNRACWQTWGIMLRLPRSNDQSNSVFKFQIRKKVFQLRYSPKICHAKVQFVQLFLVFLFDSFWDEILTSWTRLQTFFSRKYNGQHTVIGRKYFVESKLQRDIIHNEVTLISRVYNYHKHSLWP